MIDQDGLAAGRNFNVSVNSTPKWEESLVRSQSRRQSLLTFKPVVTDPDDGVLVLTASGLPAGASYDAATGFSWTPASNQVG